MAFQFGAPNYGYNPQQTYFPQQMPQQTMQQQMPQAFACHPVGSREEAIAAQTDYFSAGLIMPDLSHGMVYLKRFNQQTGASDFFEFRHVSEAKEEPPVVQYVTVEEFEKFRAEVMAKKVSVKKKVEVDEDE